MRLCLQVRRFCCVNPQCPRKTFAEQFPDWLPTYARRTMSLTRLMYQVGRDVGGEMGQRILNYFCITVSGDTVLRILRKRCVDEVTPPRIIGIDDWAFRKGQTYGTIVVNLETHRVLDLLPDRAAETLARWLQAYPSIEVVARDRSMDYAAGIRQGAPQAVQVADRWHLLLNLRQMLERYLAAVYTQLQQLSIAPEYQVILEQKRGVFHRTYSEITVSNASRERRRALYERIQTLRLAGWNILQLAAELGHHRATIRKYYYATSFPDRKPQQSRRSNLDPYLPYLEQRHREGCENALQLWREIQAQGYPGSKRQVTKWMQLKRTVVAPTTPHRYRSSTRPQSALVTIPSAKQMAWLLVCDPDRLTAEDQVLLQHLLQHKELQRVYALSQRFVRMFKAHSGDDLDPWLADCETVAVTQVQSFAIGLNQDYGAVRAALVTPWSNGQTEGQVNRLKFIKRQMYGRAQFDLLRIRVLAPP